MLDLFFLNRLVQYTKIGMLKKLTFCPLHGLLIMSLMQDYDFLILRKALATNFRNNENQVIS